jgi:hypothetical protein
MRILLTLLVARFNFHELVAKKRISNLLQMSDMLLLDNPCVPACANHHSWLCHAASCSMVPAFVSGMLLFQQGWLCGTVSIQSRKHSHHSQYRLQLLYICNASALNSLAAALTRLAAVSSLLRTYCYTVAHNPSHKQLMQYHTKQCSTQYTG